MDGNNYNYSVYQQVNQALKRLGIDWNEDQYGPSEYDSSYDYELYVFNKNEKTFLELRDFVRFMLRMMPNSMNASKWSLRFLTAQDWDVTLFGPFKYQDNYKYSNHTQGNWKKHILETLIRQLKN